MAQGTPAFGGPVTAMLSEAPRNAVIAVSRYSGVDISSPIGNIVSVNTIGIDGSCSGGSDGSAYSFSMPISSEGALAFAAAAHRHKDHFPGVEFIESLEVHQGSGGSAAGLSLVEQTVNPSSISVDGSFSGSVDWSVVAIELRPLSGP